ncbi:ROK family protein [Bacillus songklensis]|uniref:ROK family protein n=1 Tax=Bacillus songklensis TaxID=1069116 RepID=A0ABV8B376_9BACI
MIKMTQRLQTYSKAKAIGIGAPGPLDAKKGIILGPPNLPGWDYVPLKDIMEQRIALPVVVDNDANAAALAEAHFGAGAGYESVFYITVSTGVGGGFVYNKQVIKGANSCAGEIGNMIITNTGPSHPVLNKGSLELLASGTALQRAGKQQLNLQGDAGELFRLAQNGDPTAKDIIEEFINYLAIGIANVIHTVDPDIIVLGGGVMKSKDSFMTELREKVKDCVYPQLRQSVRIEPALLGTKAGIVGAAMLPKQSR